MIKKYLIIFFLFFGLLYPVSGSEKGKVYLVVGSDTAIWDGLGISIYDNRYFKGALYADPAGNGYAVMDTSFRHQLRDSYGTPMKMTWWMMAGNVYRLSRNCNIPIRNNITLYLMKKYHQNAINLYDDRLTLHYHNYYWSDFTGDGIYHYNQGLDFTLNLDDYEYTLNTYLIEDGVFPVSFRSGWHYMDNAWQAYQERFIPFDMSNAYPAKGGDYNEPTNNIIDWSQSPAAFVPYHPNENNYQIEGDLKQWRLRSVCFTSINYTRQQLEIMFQEAANGNDQMVCLWSHLPQTDFIYGMEKLNEFANEFANQYGVEFMYCKDTEAMRLWINPEDTIPPVLAVNEIVEPDGIRYSIETDGPIFQTEEPYVAIKTVYETYKRLDCNITGENRWETIEPIPADRLAKVSVAVCDSVGNQATFHLSYVPDDIFIDNDSPGFTEIAGTWVNHTDGELWDLAARKIQGPGAVSIIPEIQESRPYSILFHGPGSDTDSARCVVYTGSDADTVLFTSRLEGTDKWQHVGFFNLQEGSGNTITIENLSADKILGLDVIRITPLVADKFFRTDKEMIAFGEVSVQDTIVRTITLSNTGREELTVLSVSNTGDKITITDQFPFNLTPMEKRDIQVRFYTDEFIEYSDVLTFETDDPQNSVVHIPIQVTALSYFKLVDNDDPTGYKEFGSGWFTSVATAYGPTSRCVGISANGVANYKHADFTKTLTISGTYDIQFIVPKTVNAHNRADYIVLIDGVPSDTFIVDQNTGSGAFVSVCEYDLPKELPITLRIQDNGGNSNAGSVLRADAVKFLLVEEKFVSGTEDPEIPWEFSLNQNYPNPFNPTTTLSFTLPVQSNVSLAIYDITGRIIREWDLAEREAGHHEIVWNGTNNFGQHISTGVYLLRMKTDNFSDTRKMVFMK